MSMSETVKALYRFFGGFGLPVYAEDSVPNRDESGAKIKPPYITVQLVVPSWADAAPFYAHVWYRDAGFEAIDAKVDEIGAAIGEGVSLPTDSGAVYVFKGDPFAQYRPMSGDPALKCVYLNMSIMSHTT